MLSPVNTRLEVSVLREEKLFDFLAHFLGQEKATEIVHLGSVYCNRFRCKKEAVLSPRDHLRIHLEPRRFPVKGIDWRSLILKETDAYIIVNKPAGIPVHPTCDNEEENLIRQLERVVQQPLWIIHRLDITTSGVMILAKTKAACTEIAGLLAHSETVKEYDCLISEPVPLGKYTHFRMDLTRAPFLMTDEETPRSKKCMLEVLSCDEKKIGSKTAWHARIGLITGRHHQIRSQLSALGRPIMGDFLYGSKDGLHEDKIALQCSHLAFEKISCSIPFNPESFL